MHMVTIISIFIEKDKDFLLHMLHIYIYTCKFNNILEWLHALTVENLNSKSTQNNTPYRLL